MTTLFSIWGVAGAMLIVFFVFAWRREGALDLRKREQALPTLSHVVWEEVNMTKQMVSRAISGARPHGAKIASTGMHLASRGQEFFMMRVYGKIKIEKGLTASFFLKQIAEHRDGRKGDADRVA